MEAGGPDGFWGRSRDLVCHEVDRGGGDMGVSEVGKVGTRYWLFKVSSWRFHRASLERRDFGFYASSSIYR